MGLLSSKGQSERSEVNLEEQMKVKGLISGGGEKVNIKDLYL